MASLLKKVSNFLRILNYKPSEDSNIQVYESDEVVDYYVQQIPELQPPEAAILDFLKPELGSFRMLDIGIGAGRTTHFFAPRVRHYEGVDYSDSMVSACKKMFAANPYTFAQADIRDLSRYADGEFDLVMFSFNGLDSISPEDRELALTAIRRVTKTGKYFVFSSHNLQALSDHVRYQFWPIHRQILQKNYRSFVLRKLNPPIREMQRQNFARVVDGSHAYQIKNYWVRPAFQVQTLQKYGFIAQNVFDLQGKPVSPQNYDLVTDTWLYYLCVRND